MYKKFNEIIKDKILLKKISIGIFALVLLILSYRWLFGTSEADSYVTHVVAKGNLTSVVTATGNLQPTNQVDIGIEVSGTVASVEVDFNDHVEEGQVLARLNPDKLNSQVLRSRALLDAAKAKLEQAKATVEQSNNNLKRLDQVKKLSGGKLPSQQDMDTASATLQRALADKAAALASIAEASATLEVNETDLVRSVVVSPVKGIIIARTVEPGQTVAASLQTPTLFTIAEDLGEMELHVDVDEAEVGLVKEGQKATFTVDAYSGRTFNATISQVRYGSQEIDGVISYITVLKVDNSDLALRPGMTATADIVTATKSDVLLVPSAALRFEPKVKNKSQARGRGSVLSSLMPRPGRRSGSRPATTANQQPKVWVLNRGNLKEVPVTLGISDGVMTEVSSPDIKANDKVVIASIEAA